MTKNSALKRDARAYQREHPGTRLADAMQAVTRSAAVGQDGAANLPAAPWVRRADREIDCYFCGQETVLLSYGDLTGDYRRVQIYCDSSDCDGREVDVIVLADGTEATRNRTDVRIVDHFAPDGHRPEWVGLGSGSDWAAGTTPFLRRTDRPATCLFCGERTCVLSDDDVSEDTGRLRIRCTNPACTVQRAEAILMRDGLLWASERPVAKALRNLFPTLADHKKAQLPPGEFAAFPVGDFFEPAAGIDPLQMRISGPVPWETR
ncbi:hypothetical protein [Mycobacterium parascrofulaceum]|nr:hypothetical protein [Mycobacterium parascrofulaceum]